MILLPTLLNAWRGCVGSGTSVWEKSSGCTSSLVKGSCCCVLETSDSRRPLKRRDMVREVFVEWGMTMAQLILGFTTAWRERVVRRGCQVLVSARCKLMCRMLMISVSLHYGGAVPTNLSLKGSTSRVARRDCEGKYYRKRMASTCTIKTNRPRVDAILDLLDLCTPFLNLDGFFPHSNRCHPSAIRRWLLFLFTCTMSTTECNSSHDKGHYRG